MSVGERDRVERLTREIAETAERWPGPSGGGRQVRLAPARPPLCPEIELLLLSPEVDLDGDAAALDIATPYWAFCWASGQVLARFVLDHPERIRGRTVLDFGTGCGVVALAAALAGASRVIACDVDPLARAACARNAQYMGVTVEVVAAPPPPPAVDLVLASDVVYEPTARLFLGSDVPSEVWIADPERDGGAARAAALDRAERLVRCEARTLPDVDEPTRGATVFRLRRPC